MLNVFSAAGVAAMLIADDGSPAASHGRMALAAFVRTVGEDLGRPPTVLDLYEAFLDQTFQPTAVRFSVIGKHAADDFTRAVDDAIANLAPPDRERLIGTLSDALRVARHGHPHPPQGLPA